VLNFPNPWIKSTAIVRFFAYFAAVGKNQVIRKKFYLKQAMVGRTSQSIKIS
jgi:hypothetical protein